MLSKSVLKPHSFGEDVPVSSPTNSNLKKSKLVRQPKRILVCYFQFLFCRFLDSTLGPWFILLHLQVTGAVQRAPSARGVAEQTRLYLRVGKLDGTGSRKTIFVVMCDLSQQAGYPKRRRDSIHIYIYIRISLSKVFVCRKAGWYWQWSQNAIFLHFASAFRRSWCAMGRKVSVKLSSFGTKPSKFCLTVGKKRWDVMSLTAGDWYFSGSGMWCKWTFWCSADLPYGEFMVSMHLNSCPANKSSALIVCRGLTQEN